MWGWLEQTRRHGYPNMNQTPIIFHLRRLASLFTWVLHAHHPC